MFTRRQFVKPLGLSAVIPAVSGMLGGNAAAAGPSAKTDRSRVSLNGTWEKHINGVYAESIEVPSSQHPSGTYQLKRTFLLPQLAPGERAILHFEAIAYFGRAFINGVELGTLGPYTPHEFDATRHLRAGKNEVAVAITDLASEPGGAGRDEIELGVNFGWEAYGGIIRDVYLETRPAVFVDNVRFSYSLSPDYQTASCRPTVFVSSAVATSGTVRLALFQGDTEVAAAERPIQIPAGLSETGLEFDVKPAALWSPDRPNLYRLVASVQCGSSRDTYSCRVGFRHIEARGPNFYVNGSVLKLHGLSWLGTWKDQGFTLTRRQLELDMRGMKNLGCNFVRLHLFPQDRYVVELADELGLLVCEEPGFWQVDFTSMPRSLVDLGLRVLEQTIRRDWNSPSVFAWLLANESRLTETYLKEGKALCQRVDPIGRLVSAANDRPGAPSKKLFDAAGMDFYSGHMYSTDPDEFNRLCDGFGTDRPLIFDEWGGRWIGQSRMVMQFQADRILELMEQNRLAGEMFFSWNDFPQFGRIDAEMIDGICESGVVSESREPREEVYTEVSLLFQGRRSTELPASTRPLVVPLRQPAWSAEHRYQPVDLDEIARSQTGMQAWASLEQRIADAWEKAPFMHGQWKRTGQRFRFWEGGTVDISGVAFRSPVVEGFVRPLVVTPEAPSIEIPVNLECTRLHILGQVTMPGGFPITGTPGQAVGRYTLVCADGAVQDVPLRNGFEVAACSMMHRATRISPGASVSQRALVFVKDRAREHYQVRLLSVPIDKRRKIKSVKFGIGPDQAPMLLFAITAELA
jgi:beta-glucuronidase